MYFGKKCSPNAVAVCYSTVCVTQLDSLESATVKTVLRRNGRATAKCSMSAAHHR